MCTASWAVWVNYISAFVVPFAGWLCDQWRDVRELRALLPESGPGSVQELRGYQLSLWILQLPQRVCIILLGYRQLNLICFLISWWAGHSLFLVKLLRTVNDANLRTFACNSTLLIWIIDICRLTICQLISVLAQLAMHWASDIALDHRTSPQLDANHSFQIPARADVPRPRHLGQLQERRLVAPQCAFAADIYGHGAPLHAVQPIRRLQVPGRWRHGVHGWHLK
jgi:hypothetical protein